jgi:hypothetical protein
MRLHQNGTNRSSGYNTKVATELARKDCLFWQMVDWSYDLSLLADYLYHLGKNCRVLQGVRQGTVSLGGVLARRSHPDDQRDGRACRAPAGRISGMQARPGRHELHRRDPSVAAGARCRGR